MLEEQQEAQEEMVGLWCRAEGENMGVTLYTAMWALVATLAFILCEVGAKERFCTEEA